jgi:STIP1 homology and U-box containing protein 1
MARLKLKMYDSVIPDCYESLNLIADNMKPYFYIAQAHIELGHLDEALRAAEKAYRLCSGAETGVVDKGWERSLGSVTALVLRCKKEIWEKKENERLKIQNTLLEEMCGLIRGKKEEQVAKIAAHNGSRKDIEDVEAQWARKELELRKMWDIAADAEFKRRDDIAAGRIEPPDWLIDNITFQVMHDPVVVSPNSLLPYITYSPANSSGS